ncbi:response regulator [Desulfobacter latus]|uniref:Response regulator n=1 Tax=Desulfobacter latus TaxID=2292 RepID=A0A850T0V2_9BACT|nr:response regulator [Desulfobacter latus]NWH05960.1 response regulator [Desulfobacter latus]
MKILFVDDEKAFLDTLLKRLEKRELKADAVYDGQSAISFLSEHSNTDVVVLDVKMPGMDGLETLQAIKNQNPLIEVIMLTGHATVQNAIEGMKRGAFDYLMKPCNLEALIAKIEEAATKKFQHEEKIMEARAKEITGRMV